MNPSPCKYLRFSRSLCSVIWVSLQYSIMWETYSKTLKMLHMGLSLSTEKVNWYLSPSILRNHFPKELVTRSTLVRVNGTSRQAVQAWVIFHICFFLLLRFKPFGKWSIRKLVLKGNEYDSNWMLFPKLLKIQRCWLFGCDWFSILRHSLIGLSLTWPWSELTCIVSKIGAMKTDTTTFKDGWLICRSGMPWQHVTWRSCLIIARSLEILDYSHQPSSRGA